jgi:hypothetical protein
MNAWMTSTSVMLGDLIALSREALNVLLEGLPSLLLVVVEVLGVTRLGVGALEVIDENRTKLTPTADASKLEQVKPGPSGA